MKTKRIYWFYPSILLGFGLLIANGCKKDADNNPSVELTVKDWDNNVYHTVKIGDQIWMVENLRTTHYNDGGNIKNAGDNTAWHIDTTGAYCWYNNDGAAAIGSPYGALYNFYAVNSGKLCPVGWHVPSDTEWNTLIAKLGGETTAGGKLKESGTTHWNTPNTNADNSSGFTAVPGGYRYSVSGEFRDINVRGIWWSSTPNGTNTALTYYLSYNTAYAKSFTSSYIVGSSVRCIKNPGN